MARKVFYSFHYIPDCTRAALVRNAGALEGNQPLGDNDWEKVKKQGSAAIQQWIDGQLKGRSATVVLIGAETAGRKWIKYEIEKSWSEGKGVVGVYIHNLKNLQGLQSKKGGNPFDDFRLRSSGVSLSSIVKAYDPPYSSSKLVYGHIAANLESWVEEAIAIRASV
ncbi:TIR domain-containing protein [Streptomyces roseochromogenus]|uniref:TIR domain-containing protein n=1 Tax=Streptomyces roseochromogenus TaxID=285450 RepID=UPI0009961020|nr:TIR domain-containing protein [Streptomyces roseochromogenus]